MIKLMLIVLLLIIVGVVIIYHNRTPETSLEPYTSNIYQGPIPYGYDENHFRKTGENKLIGEVNG